MENRDSVNLSTNKNFLVRLVKFIGPAYLISVGYMDPGNWATDIAGGSRYGYQLIWVLVLSNVIALLFQGFCVRFGIVAKLDLAQASKMYYGKKTNFLLYILAEIAIAATDLAEVLGMAIGLNLLLGMPLMAGVSITVLDTLLILFLQKAGMRKFEAFIISLVAIIGVCFAIEMFYSAPSFLGILSGLKPQLEDTNALYIAIGIIGATVMPHNLYLHTALVQTRKIKSNKKSIKEAIKANIIDTGIALNLALFVNAGILILAASTFYSKGMFGVSEIQEAYKYLEPLLGTKWARILFAVALIAAGQSSTLTGTLSGQIVMEGFLNLRIQPWLRRLITRLLAIIPALLVIGIYGDGMTGELLILSQVILSLQLGFAVIPLIHFVSNKRIMGSFAIGNLTKFVGWCFTLLIVSLNIKLVYDELSSWYEGGANLLWFILVFILVLLLIVFLLIITLKPLLEKSVLKQNETPHGNVHLALEKLKTPPAQNICICVDFSETDKNALSKALQIGSDNTQYTLLHVVESVSARIYGDDANDFETIEDFKYLDYYKQELAKNNIFCKTKITYGKASISIPNYINSENFDLVVIAKHGHFWFKDLLFGTTISQVRHKIKVPLLIV